ncbi:hypothetical protein [Burkholderia multivorans]|uniref:hypothetical protein n=1 Tax=Burkholderia multivorans TaxID=87883 RepID=UPI0009E0D1AB|nr:hypothetical protein [Burkholderia multivorans]MDN8078329.1 hypothetical protein [Burkholderia multivorans]SAJ91490.1 hypothetical protein UA11_04717 [Burkholderia multivorans]
MTQPILSREEVLKIVRKTLKENGDRDKLSSARFVELAAAIEAAVLERVCGEPVKWQARVSGGTWFDVKSDLVERMREEGAEVRSLYAINRSKA